MNQIQLAKLNKIILEKGEGRTAKHFRDVVIGWELFQAYAMENNIPSSSCAIIEDTEDGGFALRFIANNAEDAFQLAETYMGNLHGNVPTESRTFSITGGSTEAYKLLA